MVKFYDSYCFMSWF